MYILKQCQKASLSIDLPQLRVISFTVFNHQQLRHDWYRHIYIYANGSKATTNGISSQAIFPAHLEETTAAWSSLSDRIECMLELAIYTMVFRWLQHYILGIWHPQINYISTQLYNKDYIQTELLSRYSRWIIRYLNMKQQYASFFFEVIPRICRRLSQSMNWDSPWKPTLEV